MRDTLLYLSTRSLQLERIAQFEAAKRTGLLLAVAGPHAGPYENDWVSEFILADLSNAEKAIETILTAATAQDLNIVALAAWTDPESALLTRLAQRLDLRATSPDAIQNVRNKAQLRDCIADIKGANPQYHAIRSTDDLARADTHVSRPALLKPAGASGGRGIMKIAKGDHLGTRYGEFQSYCSPDRDSVFRLFSDTCLLEEELVGTEHSVAGLVAGDEVYVFAISDKRVDRSIPYQYQTTLPSRLAADVQRDIRDLVITCVRKTGIAACGFHADVMVTSAGPRILEIGGRLGGECINSHLIPITHGGFSPYDQLLRVAQGDHTIDQIPAPTKRAIYRHILPPGEGILAKVDLSALENQPAIVGFTEGRKSGDTVFHPIDKYNAYALAYVLAECGMDDDPEALGDALQSCVTSIIEQDVQPVLSRQG